MSSLSQWILLALCGTLSLSNGNAQPPSPRFAGCWRGLYDTRAGAWGGGDHYAGGANSLYSGWTNAPISCAFLFAAGAGDLFAAV